MSRIPGKGDAVGGPRGAEPGSDDALLGICGGEGGGICRDWNDGGGSGCSRGAACSMSLFVCAADDVIPPWPFCGGLPGPPRDRRREGSYGSDMFARPFVAGGAWRDCGGGVR